MARQATFRTGLHRKVTYSIMREPMPISCIKSLFSYNDREFSCGVCEFKILCLSYLIFTGRENRYVQLQTNKRNTPQPHAFRLVIHYMGFQSQWVLIRNSVYVILDYERDPDKNSALDYDKPNSMGRPTLRLHLLSLIYETNCKC